MLAALVLSLLTPLDSIRLRVLSINDFHGALESRVVSWSGGRPVGGIPALKAQMDRLTAECRCPVLKLDGGDEMQGTLASNLVLGRSSVEALNLLGISAAAVGNHEFDWGVETLVARMGEARYPWLVANVVDSATRMRPSWARPYAIVTAGSFRIAVIGYITPTTKQIVMARNVAGLSFTAGRTAIEDVLQAVKRERPDFTFIAAHEGAFCDSSCRGGIITLAHQLEPSEVQLIIAGHTHSRIVTTAHGIPIVSAQANGTLIGVSDLGFDGHWRLRTDTVFADRVSPDSTAIGLVARYRPEVEAKANRVVAQLGDSLLTRDAIHPLGGIIADGQRAATKADFAVMNRGGVRRELYPGPLTYGELFELQPFGNMLVRVRITGRELRQVFERSVQAPRPDLFPSGLTVRYDPTAQPGSRIIAITDSTGRPIDPDRTYVLGLSDFIAGGGGGYAVLTRLTEEPTGIVDLDALIAWLGKLPQPIRVPRVERLVPTTP